MKVSIDPFAGFCSGVKRAIEIAEYELQQNDTIYCLGAIVHNEVETRRLKNSGLITINDIASAENSKVLVRAHGEPPSTFRIAKEQKTEIIDATCPIVLKFQLKVNKAWKEMKPINGQVVIFGKINHPEVIGLCGQTDNEAIVIENEDDLKKIDFLKPIRLFVQTTKNKEAFNEIVNLIVKKINSLNPEASDFEFYNTICNQVSRRIPKLQKFSRDNDVIVFVSGTHSSNGKHLFKICKQENERSHFITSENEIDSGWFKTGDSIGISGATSTPLWLIKKIADTISNY
jgi:4-hydroxy-3-methylbut-2-enyl diphosphate reductase